MSSGRCFEAFGGGCDKKGSEGAGFEVDPSYVYNRSKFFRGAEYKRGTERGGDDTCQSIVSLLLTY
jgi:hypothetical protein